MNRTSKRTLIALIIGVPVVALVAFAVVAWKPELDAVAIDPAAFEEDAIARGAELSALGNCAVCHTSAGGEPYAGGYSMETPFGVIYSTNITPDVQTGIGDWSQEAFSRAMREGVDRQGQHLYPAFPYHFFARTTDEDLGTIYAYIMTREPVVAEDVENELPFPFGFRPILAGWKILFHRDRPDNEALVQLADLQPGAYFVDGLGHCGACHTPINFLGAPRQSSALNGGQTDGWIAPALNGEKLSPVPWTADSLLTYLSTGRHFDHSAAAGPMRPVIASLQNAAEDDVRDMASYLASLSPDDPRSSEDQLPSRSYPPRRQPLATEETTSAPMGSAPGMADGALLWSGQCVTCHYDADPAVIDWPRLQTATVLHLEEPDNLIRVVVHGLGDETDAPDRFMPSFAELADEQLAALIAYLREGVAGREAWLDLEARINEVRGEEQDDVSGR
ncbi:MAG: cytochrome c [Mesorhizobium sp.]|nr:cytochrome c [Mesorhizobium sp.]